MNRSILSLATATLAALSFSGHAAEPLAATQSFKVSATIAARCIADAATANREIVIPEYVAYGGEKFKSTTIAFKCTKGLTPDTVTFDSPGGTLMGLDYSLELGSANVTDNAEAGVGGELRTYEVTARMAAGQAGATTGDSFKSHTLKVTF